MEYKTKITTVGATLIADCILRGEKLNILYAAAGDGGGSSYEPDVGQTALVNECWRGSIAAASVNPNEPNMLDVKFVINETVHAFTVREIGLLSEEGDLIAIANVPAADKEVSTNGASNKLTYVMHLVVADSAAINITIDSSIVGVTGEQLNAALNSHNESSAAHPELARVFKHSVPVDTSWTADTTYGGYYKNVTVSGILATDTPTVDVVLGTDIDANVLYREAWACVTRITTSANTIKLWANEAAPTSAITIQLEVVR